jgi:hypothetical protein
MIIKHVAEVTLPEVQKTDLDCVHRQYTEAANYRTQQRNLLQSEVHIMRDYVFHNLDFYFGNGILSFRLKPWTRNK